MPSIMWSGPYQFLFYSADQGEPPHVHVRRDRRKAKLWLDPVRLQKRSGFGDAEMQRVERLVRANRERLLEAWDEYFGA